MKKLVLIFCFLPLFLTAQESACDSVFQLGLVSYEEEKLDSALHFWEEIVYTFPDSVVCFKNSLHNIPLLYEQLEDFENAKKWVSFILQKDLNNLELGSDIMEPYANYHHNACMQMARILLKEGNYEAGLRYLDSTESKYPYETFSATSFEKRAVSIASWKSEFYLKQNKKDKAIWVLVNKAIDVDVFYRKPEWAGFTNVGFYSRITPTVLELIDEKYGVDDFKTAFYAALNKIKVEKSSITKGGVKKKAKVASFELYGNTYILGSSDKKFNASKFKKQILNTQFALSLKEKEGDKS